MSNVLPLSGQAAQVDRCPCAPVFFDRVELDKILNVYGRMVVAGVWRDYSIDDGPEWVAFSVYRRASERPDFRIVKEPRLARRQGAYRVVAAGGRVIRRGAALGQLLKLFDIRELTPADA